jgi:serine/threonine-protein kinase
MFEVSGNRLLLSNFTTRSTFAIENLEGGAELIKVRPRRLGIVIPFEMSRILIPSGLGIVELTAFSPTPVIIRSERVNRVAEFDLFKLDTESKYFAVLVTLCEPRLRGSSMAAVPSVREVVERLKRTDRFKGANRSNINYHIDYLADQKLPISHWAKYVDGGRMHSKREALVAFALRFDLVREEHLALLPDLHVRKRNAEAAPPTRGRILEELLAQRA